MSELIIINWTPIQVKVPQGTIVSLSASNNAYPPGFTDMVVCVWKERGSAAEDHATDLDKRENLEPGLKKKRKRVTQLAITEDRFPVGDEIHHYLILGNVLLARAKLLVPGLLTHLSGQTPAGSWILSVWDLHEGAERHFHEK